MKSQEFRSDRDIQKPHCLKEWCLGQTADQPGLAGLEAVRKRHRCHIGHSRRQTFLRPSCPDSGFLTYQRDYLSVFQCFPVNHPFVLRPSYLALDLGVSPKAVITASASLWSGQSEHSPGFSPCPEEQQQGSGNDVGRPLRVKAVKSREMQDFGGNTELVHVESEKERWPIRNWRQFSRIHHQAI